jgi:hypothetical protein
MQKGVLAGIALLAATVPVFAQRSRTAGPVVLSNGHRLRRETSCS